MGRLVQIEAQKQRADGAGEAAPAEAQRLYRIESPAELGAPLPPLTWICKGLRIARGCLTLIAGYGFSRKTLVAQDVALSTASGTSALGVFRCEHAPVVHVDYEQGTRITRERYQRLARAKGVDLRSTKLGVVTFPRFKLTSSEARDQVRMILQDTGAGLLILDSLRAATPGADENASDIREYLDILGEEVKAVDAAAIVIHHARKPSQDKGAARYSIRGSSALFDAPDSLFVFGGEKGEATTVEHVKERLLGVELDDFGVTSEDVEHANDPRWGLRVSHLEAAQLDGAAEGDVRGEKIGAYLVTLPDRTWKGSRTSLAAQVGGRKAKTLATIDALISEGRLLEEGRVLRWVG